jgi:hypothetical protein
MLALLNCEFPHGPMLYIVKYIGVYKLLLLYSDFRLICKKFDKIFCYVMDIVEKFNIDFYKELIMLHIYNISNGPQNTSYIILKYYELSKKCPIRPGIESMLDYM